MICDALILLHGLLRKLHHVNINHSVYLYQLPLLEGGQ